MHSNIRSLIDLYESILNRQSILVPIRKMHCSFPYLPQYNERHMLFIIFVSSLHHIMESNFPTHHFGTEKLPKHT